MIRTAVVDGPDGPRRMRLTTDLDLVWGTVAGVDPLTVRLDGDTDPSPANKTLVAGLAVGDRVRCEWSGQRIIVHGRAGGWSWDSLTDAVAPTVVAGVTTPGNEAMLHRFGPIVVMEGGIGSLSLTTSSTKIATIPTGWRPGKTITLLTIFGASQLVILIQANGDITARTVSGTSTNVLFAGAWYATN